MNNYKNYKYLYILLRESCCVAEITQKRPQPPNISGLAILYSIVIYNKVKLAVTNSQKLTGCTGQGPGECKDCNSIISLDPALISNYYRDFLFFRPIRFSSVPTYVHDLLSDCHTLSRVWLYLLYTPFLPPHKVTLDSDKISPPGCTSPFPSAPPQGSCAPSPAQAVRAPSDWLHQSVSSLHQSSNPDTALQMQPHKHQTYSDKGKEQQNPNERVW